VGGLVAADVAAVVDPDQRLAEAVLSALRHVRATPSLLAWFAAADAGTTAELAQASPVIETLGHTVVPDPLAARWLVRVVVSLLSAPGRDAAEERELVERFVVPALSAASSS